ncbi:unnamed protein product [Urochloa humidicola]
MPFVDPSSFLPSPSRTASPVAPVLAPVKALKSGARASPHAVTRPSPVAPDAADPIARYRAAITQGVKRARQELGSGDAAVQPDPSNAETTGQTAEGARTGFGEEGAAPGFETPVGVSLAPPVDATRSLAGGEVEPGNIPVLEVVAVAAATSIPPSDAADAAELVDAGVAEGGGVPADAFEVGPREDADAWGGLGLDKPGVPPTLAENAEERMLWQDYHHVGSVLQNTLSSTLELHRTRGLQLHERLRGMAGRKISYITDQHAFVHQLGQENAQLRSEVEGSVLP